MTDFSALGLSTPLILRLSEIGYICPTPIQIQAIPPLLAGEDLLGIAQTGTGKTAAFSLPIIELLVRKKVAVGKNKVRALVLTPTRELASQILKSFEIYSKAFQLRNTVIFGGVSELHQVRTMYHGVDVLVATPGRLLDLVTKKQVLLNSIEFFVLDEADRMLDMGFIHDVEKIIRLLPEKRQTLLFSATMPEAIAGLAQRLLTKPRIIEITPAASTVEKVEQKLFMVEQVNKAKLLQSILQGKDFKRVLVFTRTKHGANKVAALLEKSHIPSAAIHGNKSQSAREKALDSFVYGNIRVLVATDIAARGIDVNDISHVINFDLPNVPENYVHRIGRTARAGRSGMAISFCDHSERSFLRDIEKIIKSKVPVFPTPKIRPQNI